MGDLLRNVYSSAEILSLQNLTAPLFAKVRPGQGKLSGNGFTFAINTKGNSAFRFSDAEGPLPTAGRETVVQATVPVRTVFSTVSVSGLARALASGNPGSFAEVVSYSIDQVTTRVIKYMAGGLYRANDDPLALVNESPSGTELTVDTPGALWVDIGYEVDFFNSSGTYKASATITNRDWASNSITTDTDVSSLLADNDEVFIKGEQDASAGSLQARGFDGLAGGVSASGTYLSVSRSTHPEWSSNVIAAASAALDEDLLLRAANRAQVLGGYDATGSWTLLAHPNQLRRLAEVAYPRQQFSGTSVALGAMPTSAYGMSFMADVWCPETIVYGGDLSKFQKFTAPGGELQISTDFNGQPFRFVNGYDAGVAYLRQYANVVVTSPKSFFAITGLADVASR